MWPWPDSLDAVRAAWEYHRILFENEQVRVLEVRIKPGQIVPVHTHRWPAAVYILSASDFIRRDQHENLLFGPLPPHSVENIGSAEIHLITTELKEQA